jgi:hypothetical protein
LASFIYDSDLSLVADLSILFIITYFLLLLKRTR